ncbi:unnamed protein product [Coffea canephora]|uniref:Uncharacterized protein n=1 Tax=Coffea canephora TaxID=49390 RepID=A0A068ULB0_COFCA|nr:unnamed protein product [Coffea canephora]
MHCHTWTSEVGTWREVKKNKIIKALRQWNQILFCPRFRTINQR